MSRSIGASIFVRDAIKYDYCIVEAVRSVLSLDEVIVMDCSSTDGTEKLLFNEFGNCKNVRIITGQKWEVHTGDIGRRLAILANIAKSYLTTDWHFMLQADEVLHPNSLTYMRAITNEMSATKFICRRYNLWGNTRLYVGLNSPDKPVSDAVCRLALTHFEAVGDAESIDPTGSSTNYTDLLNIIHYGFVRRGDLMLDKICDMQDWFFGGHEHVDKRALQQVANGKVFVPEAFRKRDTLEVLPSVLEPTFMKDWIAKRANDTTFRRMDI